jgi:2-phosphosulfolactate phosphatase
VSLPDRIPGTDIVIASLLAGAEQATGRVAIIEMFRAFTTAAVALASGAAKITMVDPSSKL